MRYDVVGVQEFIARFFSDEELIAFCQKHFQEAVVDLAPEMGVRKKAGVLVGYCRRRGELPSLLRELEAERPKPFAECRAKLTGDLDALPTGVLYTSRALKEFELWRIEGSDAYRLAAIRGLLQDAFMAGELRRFCQDRPLFRPLLTHLGPRASLEEMIEVLLDYCCSRLL